MKESSLMMMLHRLMSGGQSEVEEASARDEKEKTTDRLGERQETSARVRHQVKAREAPGGDGDPDSRHDA